MGVDGKGGKHLEMQSPIRVWGRGVVDGLYFEMECLNLKGKSSKLNYCLMS